jgi:transposase
MSAPLKTFSYTSGPTVLLDQLCKEIQFETIINDMLKWDSARCKMSPGARIKALVINILSCKDPLYQVKSFYHEQDVELLFGDGVVADDFNDDALARALDKLYEATPWKVYSTLALQTLRKLDLPLHALHSDTTSFSVHGNYDRESEVKLTYGHSKDHRPDLKQIMLGLAVTPERIPILANAENGNISDKTWNFTFIHKLRRSLSQEDWSGLLYVADSALITKRNLTYMKRIGLRFVSRLPDLFLISEEVKQEAWHNGTWQEIGKLGNDPKAAEYRLQAFDREIQGRPYRLIVTYSSNLDERKQRSLESKLKKEETRLLRLFTELQQTEFHCISDAKQAIDTLNHKERSPWFEWLLDVQATTRPAKREGRGRPKKEETVQMETVYVPQLQRIERIEQAVEAEKRLLSTFVLISNAESQTYSDLECLQSYKGQEAAETRFRLLKDPQLVDGIYLKTPERIAALSIVLVMALLLYGILEYRIRKQWESESQPPRIPGRAKNYKPTGQVLLMMLQQIKIILHQYTDHKERILTDNMDEVTRRIVEMAGYEMTIYTATSVEAFSN